MTARTHLVLPDPPVGPLAATRETCTRCGNVSPVGFSVPDDIWRAVTAGRAGTHDTWCLRCFTTIADELLIPWDRHIEFWPVSMASVIRKAAADG